MTYYCVTFIAHGRIEQRRFKAAHLQPASQLARDSVKAAGGNPSDMGVTKW